MFLDTDAFVLKEVKYKDADKILTVLTRAEGLRTVSARGSLRKNYKYAACTQLLSLSTMNLYDYQSRLLLKEAALIDAFLPLRDDLSKLALASYMSELAEVLSQENVPNDDIFLLLHTAFYMLSHRSEHTESAHNGKPTAHYKAAFEAGILHYSGYGPNADFCDSCMEAHPENPLLHLQTGAVYCKTCKPAELAGICMPVSVGVLQAIKHVQNKNIRSIFSFSLNDSEQRLFSNAIEAFLLVQLEHSFRTLDFYKNVTKDLD